MARKQKVTLRGKYDDFLQAHSAIACVLVCAGIATALITLFLFVTFSGFGSSAEFIYNQF